MKKIFEDILDDMERVKPAVDLSDGTEDEEPCPGKWQYCLLISSTLDSVEDIREKSKVVMDAYADEYNIFTIEAGRFDYYCVGKDKYYRCKADKEASVLVEFNCNRKPWIALVAMMNVAKYVYTTIKGLEKYYLDRALKASLTPRLTDKDCSEFAKKGIINTIIDEIECTKSQTGDYKTQVRNYADKIFRRGK